MKKVISLAIVSLMLPTTSLYATDLGGVIIKGITGSSSITQNQNATPSEGNSSRDKESQTLLLA